MKRIVVANWKANLSPKHATDWIEEFSRSYKASQTVTVVLAVPFLCMNSVAAKIEGLDQVEIAAQGVSPYPPGSYTGATPASWLRGFVKYALVGHQERRNHFQEGVQSVAAQVRECVAAGIVPIICLDQENKSSQLAALDSSDLDQSLLAFTPKDAVQLEVPAANQEIVTLMKSFGAAANGVPVLYGGGVTPDNAAELMGLESVRGLLVGRGCLDGGGFAQLVNSLG